MILFKDLIEQCKDELVKQELESSSFGNETYDKFIYNVISSCYPKLRLEYNDFHIIKIPPTPDGGFIFKFKIVIQDTLIDKLTSLYPETLV